MHMTLCKVLLTCMCMHVTGGGAGIGLACVKALAQAGATVVAVDIDEEACRCSSSLLRRLSSMQQDLVACRTSQQATHEQMNPSQMSDLPVCMLSALCTECCLSTAHGHPGNVLTSGVPCIRKIDDMRSGQSCSRAG